MTYHTTIILKYKDIVYWNFSPLFFLSHHRNVIIDTISTKPDKTQSAKDGYMVSSPDEFLNDAVLDLMRH